LEALERHLSDREAADQPVLADIGCGTGILGIGAIALGAAQVHSVDTDASAVRSAVGNRDLNNIDAARIPVEQGSLERLQGMLQEPVDGFVCNVFPDVILQLIPHFHQITQERAWGILSGVRDADVPLLTWKLLQAGWSVTNVVQRDSWCCLEIKRAP
jgi:ribosomal protein L11 methyltransferase